MPSPQDTNLANEAKGWAIAGNFAAGVGGMVLVGYLVEKYWLPTWSPWVIVSAAVLGLIGGGYRFVKDAMEANKSFAKKRDEG